MIDWMTESEDFEKRSEATVSCPFSTSRGCEKGMPLLLLLLNNGPLKCQEPVAKASVGALRCGTKGRGPKVNTILLKTWIERDWHPHTCSIRLRSLEKNTRTSYVLSWFPSPVSENEPLLWFRVRCISGGDDSERSPFFGLRKALPCAFVPWDPKVAGGDSESIRCAYPKRCEPPNQS